MSSSGTPRSRHAVAPGVHLAATLAAPFALRLKDGEGREARLPARNYHLDPPGVPRTPIARVLLARSADEQSRIDAALTEAFSRRGMSFRTKDAVTGAYGDRVTVPIHGSVVPLDERVYRKMVASTAPIMRALRSLLQAIYSKPDLAPEDLDGVPPEVAAELIAAAKNSIYFEPKLISPELRDYPFLAVGGFDGVISDPDKPEPIFFEYNLGTPSGLTTNTQLLELIRTCDPELHRTLEPCLGRDDTFATLRAAVEANARAWTGADDGISVIVGPGPRNGAHPGVAYTAMFSGMPLVEAPDLYEDAQGWVRLDAGPDRAHPRVTGIYARAEASCLLQSSEDDIPIRRPTHDGNRALGDRLGLDLLPGVAYQFLHDDSGEISGVALDEAGRPRLEEMIDKPGRDPARADAPPTSLARAIKSRKLYLSNLGGREVDDKRVFETLSKRLAPRFVRPGGDPALIARPPETLAGAELERFFADPASFVVKEPDKSGGDGVKILLHADAETRRRVVEDVRRTPERFVVQALADFTVMTTPEDGPSGKVLGSAANDWRFMVMMGPDGEVNAGPNSFLLRVATPGSAMTNGSQGGGCGVGIVVPREPADSAPASSLPHPAPADHVAGRRLTALRDLLDRLTDLIARDAAGETIPRDGTTSAIADALRAVMDLTGAESTPLMRDLEDYDAGNVSREDLHRTLLAHRERLRSAQDVPRPAAEILDAWTGTRQL